MPIELVQHLLPRGMRNENALAEPYALPISGDTAQAFLAWRPARETRPAAPTVSDARAVDLAGIWLGLESIRRDSDEHLARIKAVISRMDPCSDVQKH